MTSLYHPLWKLARNYVNLDGSLMSDVQCDFYEDEYKSWLASLPSPYERRTVFKEDWLAANPNLRHDPDTFSQRLDSREVRDRASVPSILSHYSDRITKHRTYNNKSVFCCPFHSDGTASLSFSHDKKMFYCFGCGEGGDVFTFVMKMDNVSFRDALRIVSACC